MNEQIVDCKRIRALFFDAGATILKSDFDISKLLVQFAGELGVELSLPYVKQAYDDANREYLLLYSQLFYRGKLAELEEYWHSFGSQLIIKTGCSQPDIKANRLHEMLTEYLLGDNSKAWRSFDDVLPVLNEARLRGLTLGIVSNWDHTLHRVLELLNLKQHFDFVLASAEVGSEKPDTAIFEKALNLAGVDAEEAMHIGDAYDADVAGALAADITPVLIDRNNAYPEAECIRITDLRQLWDYI
jgi:putative hydrolase of the HAD superfamily